MSGQYQVRQEDQQIAKKGIPTTLGLRERVRNVEGYYSQYGHQNAQRLVPIQSFLQKEKAINPVSAGMVLVIIPAEAAVVNCTP
ncbi:hypothetical protein [Effusibacillus consociatus]|uniref:Uncharacterized protein n=1 Tax=Effusibacillus consociatus TaxID=1117041 RepID=A0ABV9PYU8_9BACL